VGEASGGKVPGVAVLPKAVDEQDGSARPRLARERPLANHRPRRPASSDNVFLHKRASLVPIDDLLDDLSVEDHGMAGWVRPLPRAAISSVASPAPRPPGPLAYAHSSLPPRDPHDDPPSNSTAATCGPARPRRH